ncbi:MAG: response regulator transcription factor, partial [Dehalococcoidia bacterium]|nr:response regulator transcription factor [Dehalococcoidia bacterium]
VVGEATNGIEAVASTISLKPDVALLDIRMPELSGVDATLQIRECAPLTAVLILSAYDDDDYVTSLLDAGAAGYLLKTVRSRELVDAVLRVYDGETVLHPAIAAKMGRLWRHRLDTDHDRASLSGREMDVLRCVSLGLHNKEIADELCVSVRTVEGHMRRIFSRLGVRSRTEAAVLAASRGWVNQESHDRDR